MGNMAFLSFFESYAIILLIMINEDYFTLGILVRTQREKLKWSQPELAEKIMEIKKLKGLHITASNGADVEVDNVWISRLEKDRFKRPLPTTTLQAVYLALLDEDRSHVYKKLNQQIGKSSVSADLNGTSKGKIVPLHKYLRDDIREKVNTYIDQSLPSSMSAADYIEYIRNRLETTKSKRALMCVYISSHAQGSEQDSLTKLMGEVIAEGLTVVYCSAYPPFIEEPEDMWDAALATQTLRIKDSQALAIKFYSLNKFSYKTYENKKTGEVLFMEMADGRIACPPAVIESRDVLVVFDEGNLEDRTRYLWAELVNCNSLFVPKDESELHALILFAVSNQTDNPEIWSLVAARIGLFKRIIEEWQAGTLRSEPNQLLGFWRQS